MKYMLRYFTLIFICTIMIFSCMQIAKNGISKVTSTDYYHVSDVVTLSKQDGKAGAVVFGKDYTDKGIAIREDHLEKLGAFNYFTAVGKGLTNSITYITKEGIKIFEKIPTLFDKLTKSF